MKKTITQDHFTDKGLEFEILLLCSVDDGVDGGEAEAHARADLLPVRALAVLACRERDELNGSVRISSG